jgi:hypothetical protein
MVGERTLLVCHLCRLGRVVGRLAGGVVAGILLDLRLLIAFECRRALADTAIARRRGGRLPLIFGEVSPLVRMCFYSNLIKRPAYK